MNPYDIIYHFYPNDTALRRLLILHSEKVRDKAFAILEAARKKAPFTELLPIDEQLVNDGALLHDLGIGRTYGPGIHCEGSEPYICHGIIGARMLRDLIEGNRCSDFSVEPERLEQIARICELAQEKECYASADESCRHEQRNVEEQAYALLIHKYPHHRVGHYCAYDPRADDLSEHRTDELAL